MKPARDSHCVLNQYGVAAQKRFAQREAATQMDTATAYDWIIPEWEVAPNVRAISTTRNGGDSAAPYASLNLGAGSGDDLAAVEANRAILQTQAAMPTRPLWLKQVHGNDCVTADLATEGVAADASYTGSRDKVLAILTADCVPVLFCDLDGTEVAAAHAGWRGLESGVLEASVDRFEAHPDQLCAWIGPCIGASSYEVGADVYDAFSSACGDDRRFFHANRPGHWMADLPGLVFARLQRIGVSNIWASGWCTASDPARFFSYRRDGQTGRMATCIWLT